MNQTHVALFCALSASGVAGAQINNPSGGGGTGTVKSVANQAPDGNGNVALTPANIGAIATGAAIPAATVTGVLGVPQIPVVTSAKVSDFATAAAAQVTGPNIKAGLGYTPVGANGAGAVLAPGTSGNPEVNIPAVVPCGSPLTAGCLAPHRGSLQATVSGSTLADSLVWEGSRVVTNDPNTWYFNQNLSPSLFSPAASLIVPVQASANAGAGVSFLLAQSANLAANQGTNLGVELLFHYQGNSAALNYFTTRNIAGSDTRAMRWYLDGKVVVEQPVAIMMPGTANTDGGGTLALTSATTITYSFIGGAIYSSHPNCSITPQFNANGNVPWITYTGTTSFTVNFATAVTGNVEYTCLGHFTI